ncbi:MAG: ComF family protein [Prolixibacteraceae bacterium]|nr:ComF family protein [Prolixibacteraceae bacterium]
MKVISRHLLGFLELFYPELCVTCSQRLVSQENFLCISCIADMPLTDYQNDRDNEVARLFWGRVRIQNATSLFHYRKGSRYQKIIHGIKYRGLTGLGAEMGLMLGRILSESEYYNSVDLIIPVPLHHKKQSKRGYNQSEIIAGGVSAALKKPVSVNNLFRKVFSESQTKKTRFERWQNVEKIFGVSNPEQISGKHILLIDDVITTGSTLEACASELLKINNTSVSIASLAYAVL